MQNNIILKPIKNENYLEYMKNHQQSEDTKPIFNDPALNEKWLIIKSHGTMGKGSPSTLGNDMSSTITLLNTISKETSNLQEKSKYGSLKMPKIVNFKEEYAGVKESIKFIREMKPAVETALRLQAEEAIKEGKIFVCSGPYSPLREELRRRGWVEKFSSKKNEKSISIPKTVITENNFLEKDGVTLTAKLAFLAYLVKDVPPKLIFTVKTSDVIKPTILPDQVVNHYAKASIFTTKSGLLESLRELMWYTSYHHDLFFPRCYNLGLLEDKLAFIDDFKLTACANFLKHFIAKFNTKDNIFTTHSYNEIVFDKKARKLKETSDAPISALDTIKFYVIESTETEISGNILQSKKLSKNAVKFAIKQLQKYLKELNHDDIDLPTKALNEAIWKQYFDCCSLFISGKIGMEESARSLYPDIVNVLTKFKNIFRQFEMDGENNIWILKPGAKSRGRGIQCVNNLNDIEAAIESSDCNLIIQKYIERPLLIYQTKFDIRLWFLITDWNPMHLWIYQNCYLRFCSKNFTLNDFHESIHLANNSVQKNYKNEINRHPKLPEDNMWTCEEFKSYLVGKGYGNIFSEQIMPAMKQCLINVLLCTQEYIQNRKGTFELFGADFMLSSDMTPWLLEINSSPSMARTTKATSTLVTQVLEDLLKVILDYNANENSDTGGFELTIVQEEIEQTNQSDPQLCIIGSPLTA